jgi:hypothetical protein
MYKAQIFRRGHSERSEESLYFASVGQNAGEIDESYNANRKIAMHPDHPKFRKHRLIRHDRDSHELFRLPRAACDLSSDLGLGLLLHSAGEQKDQADHRSWPATRQYRSRLRQRNPRKGTQLREDGKRISIARHRDISALWENSVPTIKSKPTDHDSGFFVVYSPPERSRGEESSFFAFAFVALSICF